MFAQTRFAIRGDSTAAIRQLEAIGWSVLSVTGYKTAFGECVSVDMVRGMSDEEQDIKSMNMTFYYTDKRRKVMATKQTGRSSDDRGKGKQTTSKTNFATKGLMAGDEGTVKSRRGGGIGGTVAELRNVFGKKK